MGILNRSLDESEQQYSVEGNIRSTVTGDSDYVHHFPQAGEIQDGYVSGIGVSGSPTEQLEIRRFIVGEGDTLISLGGALAITAAGTSGPQQYTFSTTAVEAGDHLVVTHAGSNAALDQCMVSVVVKATQEVKSWGY